MYLRFIIAVGLAMYLGGPSAGAILPGNFLPNPSVEEDEDLDGIPDGWIRGGNDPAGDIWDDSRPVSGQRNLLLLDEGDASYTSWYTNVDIPLEAEELQFRWSWAYQFESDNPSDQFRMTIAWRSGGSDLAYDHVVVQEDEPEYVTEDRLFPVPLDADSLRLEFVTGGPQTETGVMFIDDISIAIPGELVAGDFNQDGQLDAQDIDLLTAAVIAGTGDDAFDLNQDGIIDRQDRREWVENLKQTCFGDANLDGEFTSSDFVQVFQAGQYEDQVAQNSSWATGDWDGDLEFTSSDFVIAFQAGCYESEVEPRQAVQSVPEPGTAWPLLLACGTLLARLRLGSTGE